VWWGGFVTTVRRTLLPPSSALLNFFQASRSSEMSEQARDAARPKITDGNNSVIGCWSWEQGRPSVRRPVRVLCFVWPSSFVP